MQVCIVGLGRMGGNIARRLMAAGHECVVYDRDPKAVAEVVKDGATGLKDLAEAATALKPPRVAWVMLPAGAPTEETVRALGQAFEAGDVVIDGGNTFYRDDIRRGKALAERGVRYADVGTSGGVWGLERGYCIMAGGTKETFETIEPLLKTLAPGRGDIPPTRRAKDADPRAVEGYIHAGPVGAGHFVKMVHNGIEYGLMQAYAEGFDILNSRAGPEVAEDERFDLNLADIAEVWRRGSVVSSWLLDLTAQALAGDPKLEDFKGAVADSGEGRWTLEAAIETATPATVLAAALFTRFRSREEHSFAEQILSAMRFGFGGHVEVKG
ncbi:MAG: decarboxylating 6-phosphogluconate dehydrogenase [Proteobacteria bacterium]|nr:decarboxylating 6-phosphogluconate dehydrogenase [Pseudomonadota bacterium]